MFVIGVLEGGEGNMSANAHVSYTHDVMTCELSERQMHMLIFIRDYVREHGWAPSMRQIGLACGIRSTSIVDYNLRKLVERGYIQRGSGARMIRLTGQGV